MSQIERKTFNFMEESIKCSNHPNILVNYICTCKQKLCFRCLIEGTHLQTHPNVSIMPTRELRRVYINELDELESIYQEMNERRKEKCKKDKDKGKIVSNQSGSSDLSELKHFSQKFNFMLKKFSLGFFNELFKEESRVFKEVKGYIEMNNPCLQTQLNCSKNTSKNSKNLFTPLKTEEIVENVSKARLLKEKARKGLINKYEKINKVQNVLLKQSSEIQNEFYSLMRKFFSITEKSDKVETNGKQITKNDILQRNKIKITEEEEVDEKENSLYQIINSNINKIISENLEDADFQLPVQEINWSPEIVEIDKNLILNPYSTNSKLNSYSRERESRDAEKTIKKVEEHKSPKSIKSDVSGISSLSPKSQRSKRFDSPMRKSSLTRTLFNNETPIEISRNSKILSRSVIISSKTQNDKNSTPFLTTSTKQQKSDSMIEEEMILEMSKSEEGYEGHSYDRESILNQDLNSNLIIERSTDNLRICIDEDSSELSFDQERNSNFNEFFSVAENRNRIHKIISKKTKYENKPIFEMFNSVKKPIKNVYNNFNESSVKSIIKPSHNEYNIVTPTYISKNFRTGSPACQDCSISFPVNKSATYKKRCHDCHSKYYAKKLIFNASSQVSPPDLNSSLIMKSTNPNQFSYKAGKTTQICQACKNQFVVPLALVKQRRTCYYCFKSGKTNKE
jgi:hypothetical protein